MSAAQRCARALRRPGHRGRHAAAHRRSGCCARRRSRRPARDCAAGARAMRRSRARTAPRGADGTGMCGAWSSSPAPLPRVSRQRAGAGARDSGRCRWRSCSTHERGRRRRTAQHPVPHDHALRPAHDAGAASAVRTRRAAGARHHPRSGGAPAASCASMGDEHLDAALAKAPVAGAVLLAPAPAVLRQVPARAARPRAHGRLAHQPVGGRGARRHDGAPDRRRGRSAAPPRTPVHARCATTTWPWSRTTSPRSSPRTVRAGRASSSSPARILLAQMSGRPMLPMAYAASRAWLIKWDKFVIPVPFARIGIAIGAPRLRGARHRRGRARAACSGRWSRS